MALNSYFVKEGTVPDPNKAKLWSLPDIHLPGNYKFVSYKNCLQEFCQKKRVPNPIYTACPAASTGYVASVHVDTYFVETSGAMPTPKEAQQLAAYDVLKYIGYLDENAKWMGATPVPVRQGSAKRVPPATQGDYLAAKERLSTRNGTNINKLPVSRGCDPNQAQMKQADEKRMDQSSGGQNAQPWPQVPPGYMQDFTCDPAYTVPSYQSPGTGVNLGADHYSMPNPAGPVIQESSAHQPQTYRNAQYDAGSSCKQTLLPGISGSLCSNLAQQSSSVPSASTSFMNFPLQAQSENFPMALLPSAGDFQSGTSSAMQPSLAPSRPSASSWPSQLSFNERPKKRKAGMSWDTSGVSYKNKLNEYAQKNHLELPKYRTSGSDEAGYFSRVKLGENDYANSFPAKTRKEAEQGAAHAALYAIGVVTTSPKEIYGQEKSPMSTEGSSDFVTKVPDCADPKPGVSYKNCLQEYCQKKKLALPVYTTVYQQGRVSATVCVNGQSYAGDMHETKKQAEMAAAFSALKAILISS